MLYAEIKGPKLWFRHCSIHNCSVSDAGRLCIVLKHECHKVYLAIFSISILLGVWQQMFVCYFNPSCSADTGAHMCNSSSNEILVNVNFDM